MATVNKRINEKAFEDTMSDSLFALPMYQKRPTSAFDSHTLLDAAVHPEPRLRTAPSRDWHRDKILVIAVLSVASTLRRLGLYRLADPNNYVTAETVIGFLDALLKNLRGRVIVIWDGGSKSVGRKQPRRLFRTQPDHYPYRWG